MGKSVFENVNKALKDVADKKPKDQVKSFEEAAKAISKSGKDATLGQAYQAFIVAYQNNSQPKLDKKYDSVVAEATKRQQATAAQATPVSKKSSDSSISKSASTSSDSPVRKDSGDTVVGSGVFTGKLAAAEKAKSAAKGEFASAEEAWDVALSLSLTTEGKTPDQVIAICKEEIAIYKKNPPLNDATKDKIFNDEASIAIRGYAGAYSEMALRYMTKANDQTQDAASKKGFVCAAWINTQESLKINPNDKWACDLVVRLDKIGVKQAHVEAWKASGGEKALEAAESLKAKKPEQGATTAANIEQNRRTATVAVL